MIWERSTLTFSHLLPNYFLTVRHHSYFLWPPQQLQQVHQVLGFQDDNSFVGLDPIWRNLIPSTEWLFFWSPLSFVCQEILGCPPHLAAFPAFPTSVVQTSVHHIPTGNLPPPFPLLSSSPAAIVCPHNWLKCSLYDLIWGFFPSFPGNEAGLTFPFPVLPHHWNHSP